MVTTSPTFRIDLGGTQIDLLACKAAWWSDARTLFIADTHFGKAATLRQAGIPVPAGTTGQTLARITQALKETCAQRLVVLGDFIHSKITAQKDFEHELLSWRQEHTAVNVLLIKGNHDRREESFYANLDIETAGEPYREGPLCFCHDTDIAHEDNPPRLGGHVHPGVTISALGRRPIPCFYHQGNAVTLPAFGSFTGCAQVKPSETGICYAIADNCLVKLAL